MKIHIPEPCTENWNEMSPQQQGRHCDKCDKVVQDFTQMRIDQLFNTVRSGASTCGRFYNWQLEKDIALPVLQNPWTSWIKKVVVGGFIFGATVQAKGQETDADSVSNETIVEPMVSTDSNQVVLGTIIQPIDTSKHATHLQFVLGDFNMTVSIDSSTFSFHIPKDTTTDIVEILLITAVDTTTFSEIEMTDSLTLKLTYDSSWKLELNQSLEIEWTQSIPGDGYTVTSDFEKTFTMVSGGFTTMGAIAYPPQPYTEPLSMHNQPPSIATIDVKNISGLDSKAKSKENNHFIAKSAQASKDLIVYSKRNTSVWWWLLPIPVLLFFVGYYWKKNRIISD
ncbi:MAG: hypothetical protein ACI8SE_000499 [Bacteroidia bacterium]|jgi:hypothetical protein